jgi:hypothetical protein
MYARVWQMSVTFLESWWSLSVINTPFPSSFLTLSQALRLRKFFLASVLCVSVLTVKELLKFHFKKIMLGYLPL